MRMFRAMRMVSIVLLLIIVIDVSAMLRKSWALEPTEGVPESMKRQKSGNGAAASEDACVKVKNHIVEKMEIVEPNDMLLAICDVSNQLAERRGMFAGWTDGYGLAEYIFVRRFPVEDIGVFVLRLSSSNACFCTLIPDPETDADETSAEVTELLHDLNCPRLRKDGDNGYDSELFEEEDDMQEEDAREFEEDQDEDEDALEGSPLRSERNDAHEEKEEQEGQEEEEVEEEQEEEEVEEEQEEEEAGEEDEEDIVPSQRDNKEEDNALCPVVDVSTTLLHISSSHPGAFDTGFDIVSAAEKESFANALLKSNKGQGFTLLIDEVPYFLVLGESEESGDTRIGQEFTLGSLTTVAGVSVERWYESGAPDASGSVEGEEQVSVEVKGCILSLLSHATLPNFLKGSEILRVVRLLIVELFVHLNGPQPSWSEQLQESCTMELLDVAEVSCKSSKGDIYLPLSPLKFLKDEGKSYYGHADAYEADLDRSDADLYEDAKKLFGNGKPLTVLHTYRKLKKESDTLSAYDPDLPGERIEQMREKALRLTKDDFEEKPGKDGHREFLDDIRHEGLDNVILAESGDETLLSDALKRLVGISKGDDARAASACDILETFLRDYKSEESILSVGTYARLIAEGKMEIIPFGWKKESSSSLWTTREVWQVCVLVCMAYHVLLALIRKMRSLALKCDKSSAARSAEATDLGDGNFLHVLNVSTRFDEVKVGGTLPETLFHQITTEQYFDESKRLKFEMSVYAPLVFAMLRRIFGISLKDIARSFDRTRSFAKGEGKSGAQFVVSRDRRFCAKTLNSSEAKVLVSMLPSYYLYMRQHARRTYLCRILGLFRMRGPQQADMYILVMVNISRTISGLRVRKCYDLKGSLSGRKVADAERTRTLKDQNFIERRISVDLPESVCKRVVTQLERDAKFLQRNGIMDYSLLLTVYENASMLPRSVCCRRGSGTNLDGTQLRRGRSGLRFAFGIIDILQNYNFMKSAENRIKSLPLGPSGVARLFKGQNTTHSQSIKEDRRKKMTSRDDMVRKERVLKGGHGMDIWGDRGVRCVTSTKIYVITGGDDRKAVVWERGGVGKIVRTLEGHTNLVVCLDTTPCEKYVVTGSWDRTLILWKLSNGNRERSFVGHTNGVYAVVVTPSGDGIVSGSGDGTAILWNIHDSSRLLTFKGHEGIVWGVVVSSSGLHLYTCSGDTTAIKWSMKTGERLDTFRGHEDWVCSCCLTSDDKYLLTASEDNTAIVWNADDTTRLHTLKGHSDSIVSVSVSSNARVVATGSFDNTVILWDFQTATPVCTLRDHTRAVSCVHFSKNGKQLLTSSCDGTVIQYTGRGGYPITDLLKDIPARFALLHCLRTMHEQEANAPRATGTSLRLDASAARAYHTQNTSRLRYLMCCVVRDI
eukprot:g703.t1